MIDTPLSLKQAAALFGVSVSKINAWRRTREFPAYRLPGERLVRVMRNEALAWWTKQRQEALCDSLRISPARLARVRAIVEAAERRRVA